MPHKDTTLSAIKAIVSAVPVGGPLASLIGDHVQAETNRAVEASFRHMGRTFGRFERRVAAETVNKAEFADLFKSAYLIMLRSHKSERLKAACNVVVNATLRAGDPDKLTFGELDCFVRALDRMSHGALCLLPELARIVARDPVPLGIVQKSIKQPQGEVLEALLMELHTLGFLSQHRVGVADADGSVLRVGVTDLGRSFIRQVLAWKDAPEFEVEASSKKP
jgi:hypothetical protein